MFFEKKINAIRSLGAEIRLVAGGYEEAEKAGLAFASAERATWISPYNDGMVIAGQGTLGLESLKQEAELGNSEWVVPIGGGGLISGIGSYLSNVAPTALVSGVQSSASPFFYALYTTGTQDNVTEKASIADGLAGPVEAGSITIPIVRQTVANLYLVEEEDIQAAIAYAWHEHHQIIEGSGAVPLAAILTGKIQRRPVIAVISGGNIQPEYHKRLLIKYTHEPGSRNSYRDNAG